jgi:hypothetical protein
MLATTCEKLASIPSQVKDNLIAAKIASVAESDLTRTRFLAEISIKAFLN